MSPALEPAPAPDRRHTIGLASAGAHLVVAIALLTLALSGASIVLPVALSLPAGGPGAFASVDLAAAAVVVLLISALARAVAAVEGDEVRRRGVRHLEHSQVAGISLFLIAQLNGMAEAGALILCYAVGAASVGVLWVQGRGPVEHRGAAWPYSLGAAIAIVPWGVVALYQIVGLAASMPPAPLVRVLTLIVLVLAAAMWLVERRWQLGTLTDARAELIRTALMLANGLALLVLAVGLARPSALL